MQHPPSPWQQSRVIFPCLALFTPRILLISRLLITHLLLSVPPRHALLFFLFLILLSLSLLNLSTTPPAAAALSSHHASILPSLLFRPIKVEPQVWRPRRRPFPLCPCCSPAEGNVTRPRLPWPSLRSLESGRPRIFLPYFLTLLPGFFFVGVCVCVTKPSRFPLELK